MKSSTADKRGKQDIATRRARVFRQRLLLGLLAALVLLYAGIAVYFSFHFEPRSFVNGIDVSGLTREAASERLKEASGSYVLHVTGPEGQEASIDAGTLKLQVTDTSSLSACLKDQPRLGWIAGVFRDKRYHAALAASYDSDVLNGWMDSLPMLDESQMVSPEDAYLSCAESGVCMIVGEKTGTPLQTDAARELIGRSVSELSPEADLTQVQVLPAVVQTDENLVRRQEEWNGYLKSSGLTYLIACTKEVIDGPVIASLLVDDGEHVTLNHEKVTLLMAEWRSRHDTYKTAFSFVTHDGETVLIEPYGDYGFELNEEATGEDVIKKLEAHDRGTYEVSYYHKAPYNENAGLGGTYVEVSVDDQYLWVYKDGEVVVETDVVTGLPIYGSITYHGCYSIKKKERDVVLGTLDVQGYDATVDYWVPFNEGEGIHDAPWRDVFGSRIWLTNGSHGCVNVPSEIMGDIFENVEIGEAVVVYGHDYDEGVHNPGYTEVDEDYYYDVYYGDD